MAQKSTIEFIIPSREEFMHNTKLWLGNATFALLVFILVFTANSFLNAQVRAIRLTPAVKGFPVKGFPVKGGGNQDPDFVQVLPPVDERGSVESAGSSGDEKAKSENDNRLKLLAKLKLNRLPSNILETWYKDTKGGEELDMPPAPRLAFLSSDARFKLAVKQLENNFTLGNWDEVGIFLSQIPYENAKVVYRQILASASNSNALTFQGGNAVRSQVDPRALQPQYLTFDDLFSIASIAPKKTEAKNEDGLPDEYLDFFATAFRAAIKRGNMSEDLISLLQLEVENRPSVFTKRQCAKLLFSAGLCVWLSARRRGLL